MAIIFLKQKRSQQIFILVLVFVVILTGFIIWQGFGPGSKNSVSLPVKTVVAEKTIKIDFSVLDGKLLKEVQPFPEILPMESSASTATDTVSAVLGRENPFLP